MAVAFQRMFGILERLNNNQVTPSLSKPHELSYRSNSSLSYTVVSVCFYWTIFFLGLCKDILTEVGRIQLVLDNNNILISVKRKLILNCSKPIRTYRPLLIYP